MNKSSGKDDSKEQKVGKVAIRPTSPDSIPPRKPETAPPKGKKEK